MTNYSRTTLRELKKRYLNILKKCLLANLMAFSFVLPSVAEERLIPSEQLETIIYSSDNFLQKSISSDTTIDLEGKNITYKNLYILYGGAVFDLKGGVTLNFINSVPETSPLLVFKDNMAMGVNYYGKGAAINNQGKIYFNQDVSFINNQSVGPAAYGGAISNMDDNAQISFADNTKILFAKNLSLSKSTDGGFGGAFFNMRKNTVISFGQNSEIVFFNNVAKVTNNLPATGGAIYNRGTTIFGGISTFIRNIAETSNLSTSAIARGGAIYNSLSLEGEAGYIEFSGNAKFIGNKTKAVSGESYGGAIYNRATISFKDDFTFAGNDAEMGKDIYITTSSLVPGVINIQGNQETVGTIEGGIAGAPKTDTEFIPQINKSGTGLLVLGDNSENHEYQGAFTQTAGVTIANSERFFSHEKAVNTINGGELKTHGSEIAYKATLGETGTLTHLGTSTDTPTEIKGVTFNGTGLNLTLGTYTKAEQEKEIALVGDRIVEYVDDKGTEDTSDDELVSYQATDKLFTIKALENDQKAKFILNENLTGMEGNSITVAGAELDVADGLKVLGTVVAKDMTLSKGRAPVSFTEIEVAKSGILDIGTREMNVDSMTLQEGSTLKIALNSLQEHGKVNGLVTGSETSKIALNLATDVEMGTYQLFDQDNDIALEENLFFNIKDLENGAYQIKKKMSEEMASTFGGENQAATALALIESESSHKAFNQMQEEMLEALQSEDKGKVQKAKKALKAVGTSEQPSSQSIAAGHFNELTRVISQMAMEKEAEIIGHSGGDTDPRAKVYIKGLYDRTKSSMGEGFRARSKGAVLGVQSEVTEALTLGVGYATSQTTAKEDLRRTEVDTNTGFISAHYQPNAWWVSGLATFSRGEYKEEKQILSSMGKASYDVDSWGAQVMTGCDIKLETAVITPEVGLRYLSVKQEGYTDTLGTTVSGTRSDYLTALVGVKGTWDMGAIRPTAGVTVGYDIISDDVSALNTLANGASYTVNGEALDRLSTGVSLGVEADIGDRTTLKLEYSGTFRKEYADHSGMLRLEWRF